MEEEKKKSTPLEKLAMATGILFWFVLFTLALRIVYTVYAAFVPAAEYALEAMTDGSWYITLKGTRGAFSAAAEAALFLPQAPPRDPKGLHMILLGTGLLGHGALTWCLFWVRDLFSRCAADPRGAALRCAAGVRQMAWATGAALVLAPGLRTALVATLLEGSALFPMGAMLSGLLVSVLLWLLSLLFAAMVPQPGKGDASQEEASQKENPM